MLLDVLAALLVGGEGQGFRALERRPRVGDLQRQAFQQLVTQLRRCELCALQAAANQFVKHRLQLVRRERPADDPARRPAGTDRSSSRARLPAKSTKYFTSGVGRIAGDVVPHARPVGKQAARLQRGERVPVQFHRAPAARHVFNRVKRERRGDGWRNPACSVRSRRRPPPTPALAGGFRSR